ncbi:Putative ribonuclease H protein At1g65750 [Linum perenne]
MAEQTEKAFLKQPKVFLSSKKSGKGKRPGKGGNRFWKSIGLGFKTPREAIEGTYIDKKCPFTGTVSIRGRILAGTCHSAKMMRTIIVRRNYLHFVKKYQRYEKRHSNIAAHVSPCFRVKEGDHVIIGQCRETVIMAEEPLADVSDKELLLVRQTEELRKALEKAFSAPSQEKAKCPTKQQARPALTNITNTKSNGGKAKAIQKKVATTSNKTEEVVDVEQLVAVPIMYHNMAFQANSNEPTSSKVKQTARKNNTTKAKATEPQSRLLYTRKRVLWEEAMLWKQKACRDWIRDGDRNTRFYHLATLKRRSFNKISALRRADGSWEYESASLKGMALDYFRGIFTEEVTASTPVPQGWKVKTLSLAGRVTFAQSVLAAIPAYAMQTSVLPVTTCEEIDRRIRNFVWGTTEEERKVSLVSWGTICLPKEKGGLGLKMARQLNRAYLTKLAFIFFKEKNKLWVRILQNKYLSPDNGGLAARKLKSSSPLWKGILREKDTMLEGSKSAIRNGHDTLFWTNCWVDAGLRLIDVADTSKPEFDINCTVADLTTVDGEWKFNLIEKVLQPEFVDLVAGMTPPNQNSGEDDWVWGFENSGKFTIKSAYNLICQSEELPSRPIWKSIWKWNGPNRVRHFLWLAAKDRLLTNAMRLRRGMCQESDCEFCNAGEESSSHVLRECSFAAAVWKAVSPNSVNEAEWNLPFPEWIEFYLNSDNGLQFGIVSWYLWRARNERLFAESRDSPLVVANKAANWTKTVRTATARDVSLASESRPPRRVEVSWKAGPQEWVTLNSDGSVLGLPGRSAAGGLIRDSEGNCLDAYTINLGACSITRAEIRGAIEGVRRAWRQGYRKLEIQMDSTAAVAILLDKESTLSHQYALEALEFKDWLQRDWTVTIKHIYREANHAADYLANLGHNTTRGTHLVDVSNCNLAYFIRYDCMGISEPRMIK